MKDSLRKQVETGNQGEPEKPGSLGDWLS